LVWGLPIHQHHTGQSSVKEQLVLFGNNVNYPPGGKRRPQWARALGVGAGGGPLITHQMGSPVLAGHPSTFGRRYHMLSKPLTHQAPYLQPGSAGANLSQIRK